MATWSDNLILTDSEIDAAIAELVSACRQAPPPLPPRRIDASRDSVIEPSTSAGARGFPDSPPPYTDEPGCSPDRFVGPGLSFDFGTPPPRRDDRRPTSLTPSSATTTTTGPAPPYEDSLTNVSSLSTPPRADPPPPPLPPRANPRRHLQPLPLDAGRNNAMGLMFLLCECFERRGHASISEELWTHLQTIAPAVNQNPQILNVFVCVIQTLVTIPGLRGKFHEWARQEGNCLPFDRMPPIVNPPTPRPWLETRLWTYSQWTIVLGIVTRFLSQPAPLAEPLFLASLGDVLTALDGEPWLVEATTYALYYLKAAPYVWFLFQKPLRD